MADFKTVTVRSELEEILRAIKGARLLLRASQHDSFLEERDKKIAIAASSAVLSLVRTRLHDLGIQ